MKLLLRPAKLKNISFLIAGLALVACGKKTETAVLPPVKVNVVKAIQNDVPLYEDFVAQVFGESDVDIRSRVEGWVTSVNFNEGSAVRKGDLLYIIDDIQYKTRVDREASELASAKTEMVRAQNELKRVKPLADLNALSKQDLDNSTAGYEAVGIKISFTTNEVFVSNDGNQVVETGSFKLVDSMDYTLNTGNYMVLFEKRNGNYVSVREMSVSDLPVQ